jgi:hypothetical protein
MSTAYGAWAVQQFFGQEAFDLLLTDDPSNWPTLAFLELPLIPLSLMLSHTRFAPSLPLPLLSLAMETTLAPRAPAPRGRVLLDSGTLPTGPRQWLPTQSAWPPSPFICSLLYPVVRALYRRAHAAATRRVLGPGRTRRHTAPANADGAAVIRIHIEPEAPAGNAPAPDGAAGGDAEDAADGNTILLTTTSIGAVIGSALITPFVASLSGALLLRLSRRLPPLRALLAAKPPGGALHAVGTKTGLGAAIVGLLGLGPKQQRTRASDVFTVLWGGHRVWAECDPVWWRNLLGLGLVTVVRASNVNP